MALSDTATLIVDLIMKDGVTGPAKTAQSGLKGFGATLLGVAGAAGFGALTVGALAAERAQGAFMAATGKSRAEAVQFVSGMDSLAGSAGAVGRSFEDIAAAGTMVEQQFGTTGQKTTDLTELILEFAKVTGQDATQAAGDLDDTLTAYGLSADDAAGFTDQLVAMTQKYGTDVGPAQLDLLRKISPALQAMGGDIQDATGYLSLMEGAGINATDAQKGFNAALTNMPPGTSFDDLVTKLANLKAQGIDPTAEAIRIFGVKAGPALAQAIEPGMTSLSDLGISAQDAAGAVRDGANDMMTTSDKFKAVFDKIGAGARELGQAFGPAVTGIASIASLGAPLAKSFGTLLKDLAAKILPAAVATGTATGAAQGEAQAVAATGPSVISSMFSKIAAMAIPLAPAGTTVGTAIGAAMGAAIPIAAALGVLGIGAAVAIVASDHGQEWAGNITDAVFGDGTRIAEGAHRWAYAYNIEIGRGLTSSAAAAEADKALANTWGGDPAATKQLAIDLGLVVGGGISTGMRQQIASERSENNAAYAAMGASGGAAAAAAVGPAFASRIGEDMGPARAAAHQAGVDAGHALAMGLNDSLPSVHDQWRQYVTDSKNALNPLHEITWLEGKLSGHKLAEGLASNNPLTRARAEEMRDGMQAELAQLKTLMGQDATQASAALANNLDGDAAAAKAHAIMQRIENAFHDVKVGVSVGNYGGEHDYSGGGRAEGGPVWRGRAYIVGEHRPEVFVPNENGTIIPSIERFAGGGGFGGAGGGGFGGAPQSLALTVQVNLSSREVTEGQKHYAVVQAGGPAFR